MSSIKVERVPGPVMITITMTYEQAQLLRWLVGSIGGGAEALVRPKLTDPLWSALGYAGVDVPKDGKELRELNAQFKGATCVLGER